MSDEALNGLMQLILRRVRAFQGHRLFAYSVTSVCTLLPKGSRVGALESIKRATLKQT